MENINEPVSNASPCQSMKPQIRVYVLSGASNSGKTTTLNILADFLFRQSDWDLKESTSMPHIDATDDKYLFVNNKNGTVCGISTAGDTPDCIDKGFDFFEEKKCGICFIASKGSGSTIRQIESRCGNMKDNARVFSVNLRGFINLLLR